MVKASTLASASFVVLLPAVGLVLANTTAPQPIQVGCFDKTVNLNPGSAWYYCNITNGFTKYEGSGIYAFAAISPQTGAQPDKAEIIWHTPGVCVSHHHSSNPGF